MAESSNSANFAPELLNAKISDADFQNILRASIEEKTIEINVGSKKVSFDGAKDYPLKEIHKIQDNVVGGASPRSWGILSQYVSGNKERAKALLDGVDMNNTDIPVIDGYDLKKCLSTAGARFVSMSEQKSNFCVTPLNNAVTKNAR